MWLQKSRILIVRAQRCSLSVRQSATCLHVLMPACPELQWTLDHGAIARRLRSASCARLAVATPVFRVFALALRQQLQEQAQEHSLDEDLNRPQTWEKFRTNLAQHLQEASMADPANYTTPGAAYDLSVKCLPSDVDAQGLLSALTLLPPVHPVLVRVVREVWRALQLQRHASATDYDFANALRPIVLHGLVDKQPWSSTITTACSHASFNLTCTSLAECTMLFTRRAGFDVWQCVCVSQLHRTGPDSVADNTSGECGYKHVHCRCHASCILM
jgi:hypothetical protein